MTRRALAAALLAVVTLAQGADVPPPPDVPYENPPYNGKFTFARLKFRPSEWGPGRYEWGLDLKWNHDYPRAEHHLMKILRETTTIDPNGDGVIVALDEPAVFDYPVLYVSEPGYWQLNEKEATNLRAYIEKGGFVIFDDFFQRATLILEENMRQVLPDARFIEVPIEHPIWDSFFKIAEPPRARGGGGRGGFGRNFGGRGMQTTYHGIFEDNDPTKRLLAIANYNGDMGEFWEWSDSEFVPIDLSNEAYKLGVNYMIYSLTH
jgi:Domain of unknown function (DUF4159)